MGVLIFFSDSAVFFDQGPVRIGGRYKKALYFEYNDDTFKVKKAKASHLGFLGPIIRAEVGDTIKVVFKNLVRILGLFFYFLGLKYSLAFDLQMSQNNLILHL